MITNPRHNFSAEGVAGLVWSWRFGSHHMAIHRSPPRYATMGSRLLIPMLIASLVAFCGCRSQPHRQRPDFVLELRFYQTNQAPLATLQLVLPSEISTNWSSGQWRGRLAPTYVRPNTTRLLAGDLLDRRSWQTLGCRTDAEEPRHIRIHLRRSLEEDQIMLWVPSSGALSSESYYWRHMTEDGTCEWGTFSIHK